KPPPPRLPAWGRTTASARATATAASAALPPRSRILTPTCVASGASLTTIPRCGGGQGPRSSKCGRPAQAGTVASPSNRPLRPGLVRFAPERFNSAARFLVADLLHRHAALAQVDHRLIDLLGRALDLDRHQGHLLRDAGRADVRDDPELRVQD